MNRRDFLKTSVFGAGAFGFGGGFWPRVLAATFGPGEGPYGPLEPADGHPNIFLPRGFRIREIARSGEPVTGTGYVWTFAPDGGAAFRWTEGRRNGFIYVANAEQPAAEDRNPPLADMLTGGVSAIKFDRDGHIVDAYRILDGTRINCAGGPTPWGTWISCEEFDLILGGGALAGSSYECDPQGSGRAVQLPGLGAFSHEAAAVDSETGDVYLTEDQRIRPPLTGGRFYRYKVNRRPNRFGELNEVGGVLQVAQWDVQTLEVTWIDVDADRSAILQQKGTGFNRPEGVWFSEEDRVVYWTTTANNVVLAYDVESETLREIYNNAGNRNPGAPLREPDNITVHEPSGDLYVAEDEDDMELVHLGVDELGNHVASPFLRIENRPGAPGSHADSEIAGPAFWIDDDRGDRLFFSSQRGEAGLLRPPEFRGFRPGITYEVTGPFRRATSSGRRG